MGSKGELVSYLPTTTSSALGVLVLYLCCHIFRTYWKLRDFPGPFLAKFSDRQRVYWVKTRRAQEIHQEAHNKFGDVVRLEPNMVSLADPALIPAVYPMRPGFLKVYSHTEYCQLSKSTKHHPEQILSRLHALRL